MSAFELCITPTRYQSVRKAGKSNNESREPTRVTFGPFSGKSTVTFENVPVTKTAKRILIIQNQIDKDNKILVTRGFKPEYNIKLEWTSCVIPANSEVSMEIYWTPLNEFSCRETLQLTDSRNFQKDIRVILKSIKATNGSKKQKNTNGGQNILLKAILKKKPLTGPRNSNNKRRSLKKIKENGEQQTVLNRTFVISTDVHKSLSVIKEDEYDSYTTPCNTNYLDKTFNVSPKKCQYLNVSKENVESVSNIDDVVFDQNEIAAESTRFNVYDIGTNSVKRRKFLKARRKSVSPSSPLTLSPKYNRMSVIPNVQPKRDINSLTYTICKKRKCKCLSESQNKEAGILDAIQPVCLMTSLPKRAKYDYISSAVLDSKSFRNSSSNINNRVNQRSALHPKICNFSRKNLRPVQSSATSRKDNKPEFKDVLYKPGMLFNACINPDPFAALKKHVKEAMHGDDGMATKNESEIKKWLNALVLIPPEFHYDCNKKIDIDTLFNEVRNRKLTLAPKKEQQSSSRMEDLRAAAFKLFSSREIKEPSDKIGCEIEKKLLKIREDRNLHLNVILQRDILELLLCFNPLWLRIGLEVVFSERISLQSNADVTGLSSFIIHRLFRDKYIEQKHPHSYKFSEKYSELIKKLMLQKFLLLLLFLDKAKEKRIIKHNPRLFVKSSPYKETREVLLRFSSELIAGVGDITRMLRRYGYCLTYKQTYLDEFNYAFNNLVVDLRDGVRLTRVMEIILLRDDLTKQLRVPAIHHKQRIYNVNLALKALSDAEFQLSGNIAESDIVNGHREKTLSLLRQIIYEFRAPKFNEAAATIQKWWRKLWLKVVIERRIRYKEEMKKDRAATKIQSFYRAYMARKYAKQFRIERENAAIIIQRRFRSYLLMKEQRAQFLKIQSSAIFIQRRFRANVAMKIQREKYLKLRTSVIIVQQRFRALLEMKKVKLEYEIYRQNIIIIQRRYRAKKLMEKERTDYLKLKAAAIVIQRRFRAKLIGEKLRRDYEHLKKSIVGIQAYARGFLARKQFEETMTDKREFIRKK